MTTNNLEDVYMSLSRKNKYHIKVRSRIEKACKISTAIFYNWMKGITPVPHWAKGTIAEILNLPESDIFPEEEMV